MSPAPSAEVRRIAAETERIATAAVRLRRILVLAALLGGVLALAAAREIGPASRAVPDVALGPSGIRAEDGLNGPRLLLLGVIGLMAILGWRWRAAAQRVTRDAQSLGSSWPSARNPMRRIAVATTVLPLAAIGIGQLVLFVASSPAAATAGLALILAGGLGMVVAAAVAASTFDWIVWRLRITSASLDSMAGLGTASWAAPRVIASARASWRPYAVLGFALVAGCWLTVSARPAIACPAALTRCDAVIVPLDWRAPRSGETVDLAFGIREASGVPRGTLVIAAGGPGASGIAEANDLATSIDERVLDRYRLVLFDPRGVGSSDGTDCPLATYRLYAGVGRTRSAELFAQSCLSEAGINPADAGSYGTAHVVEDLEAIRRTIGAEKIVLYGSSYGTVTAQAYAERHPDRLAALILDAPVDRTLESVGLWSAAAHAADDVLESVFAACLADAACRADLPAPRLAYDDLMARFERGTTVIVATDDVGIPREWEIDRAGIEDTIFNLLYDPYGRMLVQRILAAASQEDDVTLGNIVAEGGSPFDDDPAFSTFAYYATLCADYRASPSARDNDLTSLLEAGRASGALDLRMAFVFSAPLPCLHWPDQPPDATRPAALSVLPFPTFVLVSSDDPVTPAAHGRAIAGALDDGYMTITEGAPHGSLWRGQACVDEPLVAFMLEGRTPDARVIECTTELVSRYIPLSPTTADGLDALDVMAAAENEIFANPVIAYWDGTDEVGLGCLRAGTMALSEVDGVTSIALEACEIVPGMPLDGVGSWDAVTEVFTLDVEIGVDRLTYRSSAVDRHVSGTFGGRAVDVSE